MKNGPESAWMSPIYLRACRFLFEIQIISSFNIVFCLLLLKENNLPKRDVKWAEIPPRDAIKSKKWARKDEEKNQWQWCSEVEEPRLSWSALWRFSEAAKGKFEDTLSIFTSSRMALRVLRHKAPAVNGNLNKKSIREGERRLDLQLAVDSGWFCARTTVKSVYCGKNIISCCGLKNERFKSFFASRTNWVLLFS